MEEETKGVKISEHSYKFFNWKHMALSNLEVYAQWSQS